MKKYLKMKYEQFLMNLCDWLKERMKKADLIWYYNLELESKFDEKEYDLQMKIMYLESKVMDLEDKLTDYEYTNEES